MSASVSVVIPVFNGGAFLEQALASVIAQTFMPAEIIVIDDGSEDDSAAIAARMGATVLRQPNGGVASARNAGIARARGDYIAFLDADDLWLPDRIAHQIPVLESTPRAVGLCDVTRFVEPGYECPPWLRSESLERAAPGHLPSCWMAHRAVIAEIGDFDETYRIGEDTEWRARGLALGIGHAYVDEVLVRRRIHSANLSGHATDRESLLRLLRSRVAWRAERSR